MKIYDITRFPNTIELGHDGENNWRPQAFDCSSLLANHPNGILTLWLLPQGASQAFPVAVERDGNTIVWTPLSEEMTAEYGTLQIHCVDGSDVGKSDTAQYHVKDSIVPGAEHPAAVPSWATQTIERAEDAAERAEEAAESIDIEALEARIAQAVEDYLEEHPIEAPVQSVNGKTGAVTLGASDVGALPANTPIPPAVTVDSTLSDSSENPVQNKVINAALQSKGTYSKPSGGIPASDLADDMPFFTLPEGGQSGQALLSDGADGAVWGDAEISEAVKTALLACFENVAWANDQGQAVYDALYNALYSTPPTQIYQDVEYIGFDGNQRIVTDFTVANNSFNISGKALFAKPSSEMFIVGIARTSDAQAEVGTSTTDNRLFFYVPQTSAACIVSNLYNTQVEFDAEYVYGTGKTLKTTINGVEVTGTETATRAFSTEQFVIGSAGTATQRLGFVGRLYSCSFISGGIEHKFIPCYRIADGVIGFRNEDATEFYTNAGTGTFTKGGDV